MDSLALAGTALVGAMVSDGWQEVRTAMAAWCPILPATSTSPGHE